MRNTLDPNVADRPKGMRKSEIAILCSLIREHRSKDVLEIGMAHGSSTLEILRTLDETGGGTLTSIDPYQLPDPSHVEGGFGGAGVRNVEDAGYGRMHTLIPDPDYLALPRMVGEKRRFDLIFIDGYHSFDFTFLDFFYADLLLNEKGVVAFHDSASHAVYKVCAFITRNKPYTVLGPPPEPVLDSSFAKALRRLRYLLGGKAGVFRQRRLEWCSLTAFRKERDHQCEELVLNDF